jgi:hypothetical protein
VTTGAETRETSVARAREAESGTDPSDDLALLERHKPLLRLDRQYDYRLASVLGMVENAGNLLRTSDGEVIARVGGDPELTLELLTAYPDGREPKSDDCFCQAPNVLGDARGMEGDPRYAGPLYGRVVRADGGRDWLQYWFWLYYNPKNLFGFGKHEGDWEMVQVGLGAGGEPEEATYAQHNSGEARRWRTPDMEFAPDDPRRPVVYVAPMSHASYFKPDTHPYFLGIDHPFRNGPPADLPVVDFGDWKDWPGKWGSGERTVLGKLGNGPSGPAYQGDKWTSPTVWHSRMRHRRALVLLGRAMHGAGRATFPAEPRISPRAPVGQRLDVEWELGGPRRGRHLYLTVHERHFVIASRIVRDAEPRGSADILLPEDRRPESVMASVYNRLRQRSDIASEPVPPRDGQAG